VTARQPGRDAYIAAARQVIAERGLENLSLREVARELGVSHQAPYKHYRSRDHLLAEVMARCFEQFAQHLDDRERCADPEDELTSLGRQYLDYARQNPLEYRLMFSTPWPETAADPELIRHAVHAFNILREVLRRLHAHTPADSDDIDLDALFVWSSMHGLAGAINSDAIKKLDLNPGVLDQATARIMGKVGRALSE
jgi:AcrR family transcriptional regulator